MRNRPIVKFDDLRLTTQSSNENCVSACIAMLFGVEQHLIIEEFEFLGIDPNNTYIIDMIKYLTINNVYCDLLNSSIKNTFLPNTHHIAICGSKLKPEENQCIIVSVDNDFNIKVLDPAITSKYNDIDDLLENCKNIIKVFVLYDFNENYYGEENEKE